MVKGRIQSAPTAIPHPNQHIKKLHQPLLQKIYSHKKILLKAILEEFTSQNLQPKIGIELEFYLQNQGNPASQNQALEFISQLKSEIIKHDIELLEIEPEQGLGQVEIKTLPYLDIFKLCEDISKIKEITNNLNPNFQVNFSSQPYIDDCGNSLQINFSLMKNNEYLFAKKDGEESKYLLDSIALALKFTKNMMMIFAPLEEDYLRFDLELNRNLHKKQKYTAPVNIAWGYDNRSALIRIPRTQKDIDRRLEYRLGAGSADIYLAVAFFLLAILEGEIKPEKIIYEEAIYGNAFDSRYSLEALPNYLESQEYFLNNNNLLDKILLIFRRCKLD